MLKKILITGGTGLIGTHLTKLLLERNYEVAYLSRGKTHVPNVSIFQYDIKKNGFWCLIAGVTKRIAFFDLNKKKLIYPDIASLDKINFKKEWKLEIFTG